jgi:hypothetical protein
VREARDLVLSSRRRVGPSSTSQHLPLRIPQELINHAMTSVPPNLTIYPDYCHTLSPTIGKWCPLRATDIHALEKVGMFCDGKLPFSLPPNAFPYNLQYLISACG